MRPDGPYLVTGAAGFIGRRLALTLRERGIEVRVLVRPEHQADDLAAAGVEVFRGDARDASLVARAAAGCSVLYHLAAARGWKKLCAREYQAANRDMTTAAALAALGSGCGTRLVLTSTATVTGVGEALQTEDAPPRPNSAYRRSRLADERLVEELGRSRGLDFVIVRVPPMVLGTGARGWTRWVRRIRDGRLRLLPRGGMLHSADVVDVVEGLRLAAVTEGISGERFLLGAERPEPVASVVSTMADALGVAYRPRLVPALPFRAWVALGNLSYRVFSVELPHHFTCELMTWPATLDIGRARSRLGYAPRFGILDSARRTVAWLQQEGLV